MSDTEANKRKVHEVSPTFPDDKKARSTETASIGKMIEKMEKAMLNQMQLSEKRISSDLASRLKEFETTIENKLAAVEETMNGLQKENASLKDENTRLAAKICQFDRERRRNNIIVTGIHATSSEEARDIMNEAINKKVGSPTVKITNVRIITTKKGQKILGTCPSLEDKRRLMRNKKGLNTKDGNAIYIDDDLCPEDSEVQYKARERARQLRKTGKEIIIGNGSIKVDGKWMRYDTTSGDFTKKMDF